MQFMANNPAQPTNPQASRSSTRSPKRPPKLPAKLLAHPTVSRALQGGLVPSHRSAKPASAASAASDLSDAASVRAPDGENGNGSRSLDPETLRQACLDAGADDVGFVALDRAEVEGDRADILAAFPRARSLISFVCRMNPTSVQSPARSIANLEFHHAGDEVNEVARRIIANLAEHGYRGLNPAMGFPMEIDRFPGKIWVVSHKRIAEAAGLGRMGIHRNLIHPRFGNFILLGTVITEAEIGAELGAEIGSGTGSDIDSGIGAPRREGHGAPIDYNPCLECKLCVSACPVGAIKPSGDFDFSACYVHNYREFMGGFTDWVGEVVEAKDRTDYRRRVSDSESASVWQSLSFGANYKAAYCMAVCPAGSDIIGPYLESRKHWKQDILSPLRDKEEQLYVLAGSDAQAHAEKHFPHKPTKVVKSGIKPKNLSGFLRYAPLSFQPGKAKDIPRTRYHFRFTGDEETTMTFVIGAGQIETHAGLIGEPDLEVRADTATWLGFVSGERSIIWALVTGRIRVRGGLKLLKRFGDCFSQT